MKRFTALFLTFVMILNMLPVQAFATDGDRTSETTQTTEQTQPAESTAETVTEDSATDDAEQTPARTETVLEQQFTLTGTVPADLPANYDLLVAYTQQKAMGMQTLSTAGYDRLNTAEQQIYSYLLTNIQTIAENGGSTILELADFSSFTALKTSWSATEKGVDVLDDATKEAIRAEFAAQFDFGNIVSALLHDQPLHCYWLDKTAGYSMGYSMLSYGYYDENNVFTTTSVTFTKPVTTFYVSRVYSQDGNLNCVSSRIGNSWATADAAANNQAAAAISNYSTDYDRLLYFNDWICSETEYNHDAAENGNFSQDANPWQVIEVLYDTDAVGVVCEGYSKTFQLLCDKLVELDGSTVAECYTATGVMTCNGESGNHMWNVVTMDDGRNYIVDVTNNDTDAIGQGNRLFLAAATGSVAEGYTVDIDGTAVLYQYDSDTLEILPDNAASISRTAYGTEEEPEQSEGTVIANGNCGENLVWTLDYNGTLTISGSGEMTSNPWITYKSDIKTVVIADGITSVCNNAFDSCYYLTDISIPDSVTYIGSEAFSGCESLESIVIPDGVTTIKASTFFYCISLENVVIPDSVNYISNYAFQQCKALKEIKIPAEVTYIGYNVFSESTRLEMITFGNKLETINSGSFMGCDALKYVLFTGTEEQWNSIAIYGDNTPVENAKKFFNVCTGEHNWIAATCGADNMCTICNVVLGEADSHTETAISAVSPTCTDAGLTEGKKCSVCGEILEAQETVDALGHTEVIDPAVEADCNTPGLTEGSHCSVCNKILVAQEKVYIAGHAYTPTVTSPTCKAGGYTTYNCHICGDSYIADYTDAVSHNIEHYTYNEDGTKSGICTYCDETFTVSSVVDTGYCGENVIWALHDNGTLVISGTGAMEIYYVDTRPGWEKYKEAITTVIVEDGVTSVGNHAFFGYSNLTRLEIPETTGIGFSALNGCSGLANDDGFVIYNNHLFGYYGDSETVSVPDNITYIRDYAFADREQIKEIHIPDSVTGISNGAFSGCTALTEIVIPDKVTYLYSRTFSNCPSLEKITLPAGITAIYDYVFDESSILQDVYYKGTRTQWQQVTVDDSYVSDALVHYGLIEITTIVDGKGTVSVDKAIAPADETVTITATPDEGYKLSSLMVNGSELTGNSFDASIYSIIGSVAVRAIFSEITYDCGKYAIWSFDKETGTLTISGSDSMYNYASARETPWYSYTDKIQKIVVGDSITSIGDYAFAECTEVSDVYLGKSLRLINGYAFENCISLEETELPDSVSWISTAAFRGCSALKNISLSPNMMEIESEVFKNCSALENITIPRSVTAIADAFSGCTALADIYYTGSQSMWDAISITDGAIPENVTIHIQASDIHVNTEGDGTVTLNSSYACDGDTIIISAVPVEGMKIKEILVDGVAVDTPAFEADGKEHTVTVVFAEDGNIMATGICGYSAGWMRYDDGLLRISGTGPMYDYDYDDGLPDDDTWGEIEDTIVSPFEKFSDSWKVKKITVENGITHIGSYSFCEMESLTQVSLPDSVVSAGTAAFSGCTALTDISIPDSLTSFGNKCFYNCRALTSFVLPQGVTDIAGSMFENCINLKSVVIPDGVESVGGLAFKNCYALTEISLPDSITDIGYEAFRSCLKLKEVILPVNLARVTESMFYDCESLQKVVLPEAVTFIGRLAFSCTAISEITLPENLETISTQAFYNCRQLKKIVIPAKVTNITDYTFSTCPALTSITIAGDVTQIKANAFDAVPRSAQVQVIEDSYAHSRMKELGFNNISFIQHITGISLPDVYVELNGTAKATAGKIPQKAVENINILWSISDETVATVDENGVVTGLKLGTTQITATDVNSGFTATSNLYVTIPYTEKLSATVSPAVENPGLESGQSVTMTALSPSLTADVYSPAMFDFSTDSPYATVDRQGVITAAYDGSGTKTVKVTARLKNDPKNRSVTLTVKVIARQAAAITLTPEIPAEYAGRISIIYDEDTLIQTVIIPRELVKDGTLPLTIRAVGEDKDGNSFAPNVKWSTSDSKVAKIKAVKGTTDAATATAQKNVDGITVITATANDITKAQGILEIDVRDYIPRLASSSVTINTNQTCGADIQLYTAYDALLQSYSPMQLMALEAETRVTDVQLTGNDAFYATYDSESSVITINTDAVVKNGTYKLTLHINTAKGETQQTVKVKVANKLPKITLKQAGTFNLFFKDSTADIALTAAGATISNVELTDCTTFAITAFENSTITVGYADTDNPLTCYASGKADTKAGLKVQLDGYRVPVVVKSFTIKAKETKPALTLSRKSTAYSWLSSENQPLNVLMTVNKVKTALDFAEYTVSADASAGLVSLETAGADILISTLLGNDSKFADGKTAHTVNLAVNHSNWLRPVVLAHKITVNSTLPTVKASPAKLTMKTLYSGTVSTTFTPSVANCPAPARYIITAANTAQAAEAAKIAFTYSGWTVTAAFADNGNLPAAGSYKFSVVPVVPDEDGQENMLKAVDITITVNSTLPKVKAAKTAITLNGAAYSGLTETALTADSPDCPVPARYEISPAPETVGLTVTAQGWALHTGFADMNNLPANGSYKFTITPYITGIDGSEIPLAPVTMTVKVATAAAKVTLGKTAITLSSQLLEDTVIPFKVTSGYVLDKVVAVNGSGNLLTPADISVAFDKDAQSMVVKVNSNNLAPGKYKYVLTPFVKLADETVTETAMAKDITLTVTVQAKAPVLKTSAKGSIDAVSRDKGITYTITGGTNFSYLADELLTDSFVLTGADADKFDIRYTGTNAKGQHTVTVTAKPEAQLSTKVKYSYAIQAQINGMAQAVTTATFKVGVKQTGLKFIIAGNTTVYHSYAGTSSFNISVKSPVGAQMHHVQLLNTKATTVPAGALSYTIAQNPDGSWKISYTVERAALLKAGKSYKLAFAVTPEGNATNKAAQTLTVTLKIKR